MATLKFSSICYVQLQPKRAGYDRKIIEGFRIVRITQDKPRKPLGGTLLAKLTFVIPTSAFDPLLTARIELPEGGYEVTPEVSVEPFDEEGNDD